MYNLEEIKNTILQGHILDILKNIPSETIDMVITSPPYYGLRNYNTNPVIWGGDENCNHQWESFIKKGISGGTKSKKVQIKNENNFQIVEDSNQEWCPLCEAWKGELGAEPSFHMYINHLLEIFNEINRILKKEGSCWVNLGDSYSGSCQGAGYSREGTKQSTVRGTKYMSSKNHKSLLLNTEIPKKSLMAIPDRFKIAMIDNGWICRNEIIWCLDENTKIFTRNEFGKFENKKIKDITKNDFVLSFDKNKKNIWVKVKNIFYTGEKTAYKIITKSGKEIISSENHLFGAKSNCFANKNSLFIRKPKFKQLKELCIGDRLLTNEFIDSDLFKIGNEDDYDDGFIVGFYLAEGNYIKNRVGKYTDSVYSLASQKRWGRLPQEENRINGIQFSCGKKDVERGHIEKIKKYNINIYEYGNSIVVASRDKKLLNLIENNVDGEGSHNQHCSQNVFNESLIFMKGIVDGFCAGDGHDDKKNNRIRIGICNNEDLKNDLLLLSRILHYNFRSNNKFSKMNDRKFPSIDITIRKDNNRNIVCGMMTDEIESIDCIGKKKMYDITIDEIYPNTINNRIMWYNNLYFLSNGIMTHNCKPNAMPESVKDRFTVDFEKLFFFTKNQKYYFKQQLEEYQSNENHTPRNRYCEGKYNNDTIFNGKKLFSEGSRDFYSQGGRNKRCVWNINTQPLKDTHFATFPEKLLESPIDACCPEDGVVLDPFMGSGTTAIVALKQNKNYIGIELNPEYIEIANKRISEIEKNLAR